MKRYKNQFEFTPSYRGHYQVIYRTFRGDYWRGHVQTYLTDAVKYEAYPTQRAMCELVHCLKENGTHYNKRGGIIE